jgi:heme exporter protein C
MKNWWWKILSLVLLTYVLIFGLRVPLRTGIMQVSPSRAETGDTIVLKIEGYNSNYKQYKDPQAFLSIYEVASKKDIKAYSIRETRLRILDDRHLEAQFIVPKFLPTPVEIEEASLSISDASDGTSIRPSALTLVHKGAPDTLAGKAAWAEPIDAPNRHGFVFPYRNILYETIRNTYFHVPMWFVMFTLFGVAVWHSIKYLRKPNTESDVWAVAYTQAGVAFGLMGFFSGALWAQYTWGKAFPYDIKLIMTYTALGIYLAYFILRGSFENLEQRARISAVYSIFAFASLVPLIYVVPKLADSSLHPGNGSNIAFGSQDLDNTMRMVFYPACIGWILLGIWVASLTRRYMLLKEKLLMEA